MKTNISSAGSAATDGLAAAAHGAGAGQEQVADMKDNLMAQPLAAPGAFLEADFVMDPPSPLAGDGGPSFALFDVMNSTGSSTGVDWVSGVLSLQQAINTGQVGSANEAVEAALGGFFGLMAGDVSYTGSLEAAFLTDDFNIEALVPGLPSFNQGPGIMLSSGGFPGDRNTESSFSVNNGQPGDPDLDALVQAAIQPNLQTYDAAVIEFTINVTDPDLRTLEAELIFGSEEGPFDFGSSIADIAALFVNGENRAFLKDDPNLTFSSFSPYIGEGWLLNNRNGNGIDGDPSSWDGPNAPYGIQWGVFSRPTVINIPLQLGLNTVKIAVADTSDRAVDSGLFISNLQLTDSGIEGVFNSIDALDLSSVSVTNFVDKVLVGDQQIAISGNPEQHNNNLVVGFKPGDQLVFEGTLFGPDQLSTAAGPILEIDTTLDGDVDTTVTLIDPAADGFFIVSNVGDDTVVLYSAEPPVQPEPGVDWVSGVLSLQEAIVAGHVLSADQAIEFAIGGFFGLSVSDVSYTGSLNAAFVTDDFTIEALVPGLPSFNQGPGILLSSGGFPGDRNTEEGFSVSHGQPGDPDLDATVQDAIQPGLQTADASVIEFTIDVTDPNLRTLEAEVIFGSEEFPNVFGSTFVDIAAVYVNGENRAFLNEDPNQVFSSFEAYIDGGWLLNNRNGNGIDGSPQPWDGPNAPYGIQWGVFSRPTLINVPLELGLNTIKIAVADTGDTAVDSGLFISDLQLTGSEVEGVYNLINAMEMPSVSVTNLADQVRIGEQQVAIFGTPQQHNNNLLFGFKPGDQLVFQDTLFGPGQLSFMDGPVLQIDTTLDGVPDTAITLIDFDGGDFPLADGFFFVSTVGGDTVISYATEPGIPPVPGVPDAPGIAPAPMPQPIPQPPQQPELPKEPDLAPAPDPETAPQPPMQPGVPPEAGPTRPTFPPQVIPAPEDDDSAPDNGALMPDYDGPVMPMAATVSGVVFNAQGNSLSGLSLSHSGSGRVQTAQDGAFSFQVLQGSEGTLAASSADPAPLSIDDGMAVLRAAMGLTALDSFQFIAADVDGDGAVTAADAQAIFRHVSGLDTVGNPGGMVLVDANSDLSAARLDDIGFAGGVATGPVDEDVELSLMALTLGQIDQFAFG